ncbi:MAG: glycosyltransferase, partial [Alphaproteobacteria bacterium]|nr:glycosyltransferase [Alphaproteobacteria bacterium]
DRFVMRELFIKQCFSQVDRFVSPSEFLKRRYVEWGLPEERIAVIRNGISEAPPAPHRPLSSDGKRNRFAYFGHLNPYKGALVAIEAARRLATRHGSGFSLALHGAADFQTDAFKETLRGALESTPQVSVHGRYPRDDMPALMAEVDWVVMPSVWWENAPLVIQEAFRHGRPVICSGIGGMAEAVRHGVDGLHARPGDAAHLAQRMEEALDAALWDRLVAGIRPPETIRQSAERHLAFYRTLQAVRPGSTEASEASPVRRPRRIA